MPLVPGAQNVLHGHSAGFPSSAAADEAPYGFPSALSSDLLRRRWCWNHVRNRLATLCNSYGFAVFNRAQKFFQVNFNFGGLKSTHCKIKEYRMGME